MIRLRRESQLCRVRVTKPSHWISSRSVQHILLRSQLLNEGATSAYVFGALGLLRGPDRPFPEVCLSVWLDPALHSHIRTQRRDCESQSSMTLFLSLFLSSLLFLRFPWDRIKKSVVLERESESTFLAVPCHFRGTASNRTIVIISTLLHLARGGRRRRLEEDGGRERERGKRLEFQIPTRWMET